MALQGSPDAFGRAEALVRTVCTVAGSMSFLDEIDTEARKAGLDQAIARGETPPIFDWLLTTFSFQGISGRVAWEYMDKHGTASWAEMRASLKATPSLALAEATVPQIATFTGHSLKDVEAILDAHYLGRDIQLAEAAVLKLEKRTKL